MYKHVLHVKQLPKRFHCPSAFILRTLTKTSHWKLTYNPSKSFDSSNNMPYQHPFPTSELGPRPELRLLHVYYSALIGKSALPNDSTTPITQGTTMKPHKTREKKIWVKHNLTALCWFLQMSSRTFNARTREEILELVHLPIYRQSIELSTLNIQHQFLWATNINWTEVENKIHQRYITARHFRTKHTYTLISV